jgi:hypothetical protein
VKWRVDRRVSRRLRWKQVHIAGVQKITPIKTT